MRCVTSSKTMQFIVESEKGFFDALECFHICTVLILKQLTRILCIVNMELFDPRN